MVRKNVLLLFGTAADCPVLQLTSPALSCVVLLSVCVCVDEIEGSSCTEPQDDFTSQGLAS
eukprot:m.493358 g.493358  ORF g.493358 m.493358 type:complete len:61 (+) comp36672_c0_seq1:169-351(+)